MTRIVAAASRNNLITTLLDNDLIVEWNAQNPMSEKWTREAIGKLPRIIKLCRGYEHSLALTKEGVVYGWGSGKDGQLGKRTDFLKEPRKIQGLPPIKRISSSSFQNLALDYNGKVWIWGGFVDIINKRNTLVTSSLSKPKKIGGKLKNIKEIVSGRNEHLILGENGKLWSLDARLDRLGFWYGVRPERIDGPKRAWTPELGKIEEIRHTVSGDSTYFLRSANEIWYYWRAGDRSVIIKTDILGKNLENFMFANIVEFGLKSEKKNPEIQRIWNDPRSGSLYYSGDILERLYRRELGNEFTL